MSLREVTLLDLEAEIARAAHLAESRDAPEPEAIVVLLIPRGNPFEAYAAAMAPGIAASQGRARCVKIDTTAEPDAPARFGLAGAPGIVLFVGGRQVMAMAVPFAGAVGAAAGPFLERLLGGIRGMLPPGGSPR